MRTLRLAIFGLSHNYTLNISIKRRNRIRSDSNAPQSGLLSKSYELAELLTLLENRFG